MPSTATPYGLKPIGLIGGRPYNGAFRLMPILSTYNTAIFTGDVVKIGSDGTIQKDTGTATATPVGVFLGCQYTDSDSQLRQRPMWTAGTTATDAYAFVADDPDLVFSVQGTVGSITTLYGNNAALVQGTGNSTTGISGVSIGSFATTGTLPIRLIDIQRGPDNAIGDTYPFFIVKWNATMHLYNTATGTG